MTSENPLVDRLDAAHRAVADPERAIQIRRDMRDQFAFLGIPSPTRADVGRDLVREAAADVDPLPETARWCFAEDEREFQYFACHALERAARRRLGVEHLPLARELITTKSWWDTVDRLAANVVGPLVRRFPDLRAEMDAWIAHHDMWLRRSAILHQLKFRADTDADRLFAYAERCAGERKFFMRKAIGWALREYAKTDPDAVGAFVAAMGDRLSPLSVREATKHLR